MKTTVDITGAVTLGANAAFQEAGATNLTFDNTVNGNNPSGTPSPGQTVFYSRQQQCSWTCPDGSLYVFTALAGYVHAGSQAQADASVNPNAYAAAAVVREARPPQAIFDSINRPE